MSLFKLYLVTDRKLCRDEPLESKIEKALKAGVKAFQLREKDLCARNLLPLALALRKLATAYRASFFMNDRLDYVLSADADGLHCPEAGLAPSTARPFLSSEKKIGKSVHSLEKALEAERERADFITFGPIFQTPSKEGILKPQGLEMLKKVAQSVHIPVYALGGITPERAKVCLASGAYGVAVISAILSSQDIPRVVAEFHEALSAR